MFPYIVTLFSYTEDEKAGWGWGLKKEGGRKKHHKIKTRNATGVVVVVVLLALCVEYFSRTHGCTKSAIFVCLYLSVFLHTKVFL